MPQFRRQMLCRVQNEHKRRCKYKHKKETSSINFQWNHAWTERVLTRGCTMVCARLGTRPAKTKRTVVGQRIAQRSKTLCTCKQTFACETQQPIWSNRILLLSKMCYLGFHLFLHCVLCFDCRLSYCNHLCFLGVHVFGFRTFRNLRIGDLQKRVLAATNRLYQQQLRSRHVTLQRCLVR